MNRLQIREAVRDILGEQHEGFWKDAELDRYLQLACNRHAQEALSVPTTEKTTSLPGIQEYVLPPTFGEMRRVRWRTDTDEVWGLRNAPKEDIINREGSEFDTITGDPTVYYHDANRIGLYPVPNKKAIFSFAPDSDTCEDWQTIDTARHAETDAVTEIYSEDVYIRPENVCNVVCSHVSLWMRRNARPVDGAIRLRLHPLGRPDYEYWFSGYINTRDLGAVPEWVHFDFTYNPVVLTPDIEGYNFTFILNQDFYNTRRAAYGSEGPQFAVERSGDAQYLYFQFHELRQDIELDFYKNEVASIDTDHEELEVPNVYHRTLVKMVVARALRKGSRDLTSALYWEAEAEKEIKAARTQAALRTRGRMLRTEGASRYYGPDATYDAGTGAWRIRPW